MFKRNSLRGQHFPLRVIGLGDSITANDSFLSPSGLWTMGNGYYEELLRQTTYLTGTDFVFVSNAGSPGNTTPQMLARMDADVIAHHPDLVFLMAGTNDILPGASDADYAAFFNTLEKIVLKLLIAGSDVILSTCCAKDAAPAEMAKAIPMYYMLAHHYGLRLIDAHRATADPVTGQYKSGFSDDGTHPNAAGIAEIVSRNTLISTASGDFGQVYLAAVAATETGDMPNMFVNGNFQNSTTPPNIDGWDVNTSDATFALSQNAQGGKTFAYTKTAAGGVYALYGTGITGGFDDGDTLVFSGKLNVSGMPVPADGFTMLMQFDGGDSFRPYNTYNHDLPTEVGAGKFSMEAVVPAGYAGNFPIIPQLYVQDVGVYSASDFTLWNKTKYEAIWKPGALLNV